MINIIDVSTKTAILFLALSCFSTNLPAQTNKGKNVAENEKSQVYSLQMPEEEGTSRIREKVSAPRTRPRMSFIKKADFYLRSGQRVSGKVISEDKSGITVEQLDESRIIVSPYSKRDIEPRTLHTKSQLEANYYLELAEYFSARTHDFKDDPDDFIQAIRCCEKAKKLVEQVQGKDSEKVGRIDEKVRQLQADREVWIREVTSRAELKKLEYEATIETRVKKLEDKVNAVGSQVNKSIEQLNKVITDMKNNQQKLEENISAMDKNLSGQLDLLEAGIVSNRRRIDRLDDIWRWYLQPPYPLSRPYIPEQK